MRGIGHDQAVALVTHPSNHKLQALDVFRANAKFFTEQVMRVCREDVSDASRWNLNSQHTHLGPYFDDLKRKYQSAKRKAQVGGTPVRLLF